MPKSGKYLSQMSLTGLIKFLGRTEALFAIRGIEMPEEMRREIEGLIEEKRLQGVFSRN